MSESYMIAPQQIIRVKLGRSKDPKSRRNTLQTGSSDHLLLLAYSDKIQEHDLHERFKEYRQGDGGTEFFNLPLDKFLELYDEFPKKTKISHITPKTEIEVISQNNIEIEWDRVSKEKSNSKNRVYTLTELQTIAKQLGITTNGVTKPELVDRILKHHSKNDGSLVNSIMSLFI